MSPSDVSPLASNIIAKIPDLLGRIQKYNFQNEELKLRCHSLEVEIGLTKGRIDAERSAQAAMKIQLGKYEEPKKMDKQKRAEEEEVVRMLTTLLEHNIPDVKWTASSESEHATDSALDGLKCLGKYTDRIPEEVKDSSGDVASARPDVK